MAAVMEGYTHTTYCMALVASTKRTAFVVGKTRLTACTAASQPPCCPVHTCKASVTHLTSGPMTARMAFPQFFLAPRQYQLVLPLGIYPELYTSLRAVKAVRPEGSTYWLLMHLASMATA